MEEDEQDVVQQDNKQSQQQPKQQQPQQTQQQQQDDQVGTLGLKPDLIDKMDNKSFNSVYDKNGNPDDLDWFYTFLDYPGESTSNLEAFFGAESFGKLKDKDYYWRDESVRKKFTDIYALSAKLKYEEFYEVATREFSKFKLKQHTRKLTPTESFILDTDKLRTTIDRRFGNSEQIFRTGKEWSNPIQSQREASSKKAREAYIKADGTVGFNVYDLSSDLYNYFIGKEGVSGFAYNDQVMNMDPSVGVYASYVDVIKDGLVYDDNKKAFVPVRDDQIVSRTDMSTGSIFDGVLNNNKLERDSIFDFVKMGIRTPLNTLSGLADAAIQSLRAIMALTYGGINLIKEDDLKLEQSKLYKELTNAGIFTKGFMSSTTDFGKEHGFFGSLEVTVQTVFDVAAQIGVARALGTSVGFMSKKMLAGSLSGAALETAVLRNANLVVRSTLTAYATRTAYNHSMENGFTPTEAGAVTVATFIGMWYATKFAEYITGGYDIKKARNTVTNIVKKEIDDAIIPAFRKINQQALEKGTKSVITNPTNNKILLSISKMTGKLKDAMASIPAKRWVYESRQEALEEMSEELAQDLIEHGASAYGYIMKDNAKVGKGRFKTIFDEGFFEGFLEKYAVAGISGGMAGPMGMIGSNSGRTTNITDSSNLIDVIASGKENVLKEVLESMRDSGELGPTELSTEYNEQLGTFKPILKGEKKESLGDMVYNSYMHDINVIKTFLSTGMQGKALEMVKKDATLSGKLDDTAMRKDFIYHSSKLMEIHNRTGLPMSIYAEMDDLTEAELETYIPKKVVKINDKINDKLAELNKLKESIKNTKPDKEDDGKLDTSTPGKLKKEAREKRYGDPDEKKDRLEALNRSVDALEKVTEDDIKELFSSYRIIRSIANGVSSEKYLLQMEMFEDDVLGHLDYRDPEYDYLGVNPFVDLLHKATLRSLDDEKEFLKKGTTASGLTREIKGYTKFDPDEVNNIFKIIFGPDIKSII